MRILVTGWFSFPQMGASAGDLLTRDLACEWLNGIGCAYDVALADPFRGGVDWRSVNPDAYDCLLFVCGPFGNGPPVNEMLERFRHCAWIGLNLSMLQPLDEWNPFQLLLERDSSRNTRPDLAFLAEPPKCPIIGIVLIDAQPEYGDRDLHQQADGTIADFLSSCDAAILPIETRLDQRGRRCATAAQVETLISRVDLVITTRLHGLVLSLKNRVPAIAIDTVRGGAKVTQQAKVLSWPIILSAEDLTREHLQNALEYCLSAEARREADACCERARALLKEVKTELQQFMTQRKG